MNLIIQIKTIVASIIFGVYFSIILSLSYRLIYHKKEFVKLIFTPIIIGLNTILYFFIIKKINYGIFHIYEILCIIFGVVLETVIAKVIANIRKK